MLLMNLLLLDYFFALAISVTVTTQNFLLYTLRQNYDFIDLP